MKEKYSEKFSNLVWINKENKIIRIDKKDIQMYIDNGWFRGRKIKS